MNRSYRLGLQIVLGTVVASAFLATLIPPPRPTRAALALDAKLPPLGAFRLTERSGRTLTDADLADRVWIASFIFTRCRSSCPRITAVMKELQNDGRLAGTGVQLVSLSVDPEHDTPQVLAWYASSFGADPRRWWFLTGPKDAVYRLIRRGFLLGVEPLDPNDPQAALMDISHSNRLALVDRGNRVVGLFNSKDRQEVDHLIARARRLDMAWVARLPAVNAALNGLSTLLLLLGLGLIRTRRVRGHVGVMIAALVVSGAFLACYLIYHAEIGGGMQFRGLGASRLIYFTVLISHVVLAAAVVPLVVLTVARAVRRRFASHTRIARVTYPIWLYVSITGVVVYVMLYRLHFTPVFVAQ